MPRAQTPDYELDESFAGRPGDIARRVLELDHVVGTLDELERWSEAGELLATREHLIDTRYWLLRRQWQIARRSRRTGRTR